MAGVFWFYVSPGQEPRRPWRSPLWQCGHRSDVVRTPGRQLRTCGQASAAGGDAGRLRPGAQRGGEAEGRPTEESTRSRAGRQQRARQGCGRPGPAEARPGAEGAVSTSSAYCAGGAADVRRLSAHRAIIGVQTQPVGQLPDRLVTPIGGGRPGRPVRASPSTEEGSGS
jgi:hypothetical protein